MVRVPRAAVPRRAQENAVAKQVPTGPRVAGPALPPAVVPPMAKAVDVHVDHGLVPAVPAAGAGYRALLGSPLFLLVWAAQVLSQTAQNVVNFALVVEVERLTHSSTNVGWVIVSFSLPALLLGPSAGVF